MDIQTNISKAIDITEKENKEFNTILLGKEEYSLYLNWLDSDNSSAFKHTRTKYTREYVLNIIALERDSLCVAVYIDNTDGYNVIINKFK